MADFSNDVEKALPPRKGKSKRSAGPRGVVLRPGEKPDWKTWGEVIVFQTDKGDRTVIPRGSMDEDRWSRLTEAAKATPGYAGHLDAGEPVDLAHNTSLDPDTGRLERVRLVEPYEQDPNRPLRVIAEEPKTEQEVADIEKYRASKRPGAKAAPAAAKTEPVVPGSPEDEADAARIFAEADAEQALADEGLEAVKSAKVIGSGDLSPDEAAAVEAYRQTPLAAAKALPHGPEREKKMLELAKAGALPEVAPLPPDDPIYMGGDLGPAPELAAMAPPPPGAPVDMAAGLSGPPAAPRSAMDQLTFPQPGENPFAPAGPTAGQALPLQAQLSAGKAGVDAAANTERAMQAGLVPRPGAPGGAGGPPGAGGSMSASVSGGGGFQKPRLQYPQVDRSAEDALRDEAARLNETTDNLLRDEADRQVALKTDLASKQADIDRLNAAQAEGFERNYQEMERYQSAAQQTLAEMQARSTQSIDTGRYFRNAGIAKQVMSVLAGALYGFLGKGLEWQAHLDGLVEQDIRAQESDRDAALKGLDAKAKGYFNARDFAMSMGARKDEAYAIQKAAVYKAMDMYLANAERETKNADVKMRAAQMRFDIGNKIVDAQQRGAELVQRRVDQMNSDALKVAALEMQDRHFRAQVALKQQALAAKGKSGRPLPSRLAQRFIQVQDADKTIDQMKKLLSKGVPQTLGDESVKHGPGMLQNAQEAVGLTDAPSRRVLLASMARSLIAGVEARPGALTLSDDAALKEFGLDVGLASAKTDAILEGWRERAKAAERIIREVSAGSGYTVPEGGEDEGDDAFEPSEGE